MSVSGKILCLPGYLQSGRIFAEKSSGLRKLLTKKLNLQLDYIDPPIVIDKKEDLPFSLGESEDEAEAKWASIVDQNLNRCWWQHRSPGNYEGFPSAFQYVVDYVKQNGPYDGIIGFSQGAAMAAMALNELIKTENIKIAVFFSGFVFTQAVNPEDDMANLNYQHEQIAEYATKVVLNPEYAAYFSVPNPLHCKVVNIYGSADMVVPAIRSKYLSTLYPESSLTQFEHDGGHFIPNKKPFLNPIVDIFKDVLEEKSNL